MSLRGKLFNKFVFLQLHLIFLVPPCENKKNGTNGGCEHMCTNDGDEVKCSCREGYNLNKDRKTCSEGLYI